MQSPQKYFVLIKAASTIESVTHDKLFPVRRFVFKEEGCPGLVLHGAGSVGHLLRLQQYGRYSRILPDNPGRNNSDQQRKMGNTRKHATMDLETFSTLLGT